MGYASYLINSVNKQALKKIYILITVGSHCFWINTNETSLYSAIFIIKCFVLFFKREVTRWEEMQCLAPSQPAAACLQRIQTPSSPFSQHETAPATAAFGQGKCMRGSSAKQESRLWQSAVILVIYYKCTGLLLIQWEARISPTVHSYESSPPHKHHSQSEAWITN